MVGQSASIGAHITFEKVAERSKANQSMVEETFYHLPKLVSHIPITWRNSMSFLIADRCFELQGWEVEVGGDIMESYVE